MKGGTAVREWRVGLGGRATAAHLGYIWGMTTMRCLLLSSTCSMQAVGGLYLTAASFCWLPASLKCRQLSCVVHCSSCACGSGAAWHHWGTLCREGLLFATGPICCMPSIVI